MSSRCAEQVTKPCSVDGGLEPIVRLFHVECQIVRLLFAKLLTSLHLIQSDEPLYYFPSMLEVLIRDLVD